MDGKEYWKKRVGRRKKKHAVKREFRSVVTKVIYDEAEQMRIDARIRMAQFNGASRLGMTVTPIQKEENKDERLP